MQDNKIIVITESGSYNLDEEDLEPLGDVVYFGGSKVHRLEEAVIINE